MESTSLRDFLKLSACATAGMIALTPAFGAPKTPPRLFKISLNPFAVGVSLRQEEMIAKAVAYGFEAILPIPAQLAEMTTDQRQHVLEKMRAQNLSWDAAGNSVDFRTDENLLIEGMASIPSLAEPHQ